MTTAIEWDKIKGIIQELADLPIPANQMSGEGLGYSDATRHIFWLYRFEPKNDYENIDYFSKKYDLNWLFGPYASVLYKHLHEKRLNRWKQTWIR